MRILQGTPSCPAPLPPALPPALGLPPALALAVLLVGAPLTWLRRTCSRWRPRSLAWMARACNHAPRWLGVPLGETLDQEAIVRGGYGSLLFLTSPHLTSPYSPRTEGCLQVYGERH